MRTDPSLFTDLPRNELLTLARESLTKQAASIYDPDAMKVISGVIDQYTEIMEAEQLAHIVARGAV